MRILPILAVAAAIGVAAPTAWSAPEPASETAATPAGSAVSVRPLPFRSIVVSVDSEAKTFRMGKKVIRQVHILPATRVMKGDGTPGTFDLLRPGEEVRGSFRKRADGDYDAVSVKIGPKPAKALE